MKEIYWHLIIDQKKIKKKIKFGLQYNFYICGGKSPYDKKRSHFSYKF